MGSARRGHIHQERLWQVGLWRPRFREPKFQQPRKHTAIKRQPVRRAGHKFHGRRHPPDASDATDALRPSGTSCKAEGLRLGVWHRSLQDGLRRALTLAPDDGTFSSAIPVAVQSKIGSGKSKSISDGEEAIVSHDCCSLTTRPYAPPRFNISKRKRPLSARAAYGHGGTPIQ